MHRVHCSDCGKAYDYDEDAFCPRCGAFNQPPKSVLINEAGEVTRVDGINEQGHANSFVHQELHEENRQRRWSGLDKSVLRVHRGAEEETDQPVRPAAAFAGRSAKKPAGAGTAAVITWIIIVIIVFNLLRSLFGAL